MYCDKPQTAAGDYDKSDILLVQLRYLGKSAVALRGTITRNLYQFSEFMPVQTVDRRDARYLLATKLFGIAQ